MTTSLPPLARLDELGAAPPADGRDPRTENAATEWARQLTELMNGGRLDEVAEMYAVDVVAVDRRSVVSVPTLHGRAAIRENLEALRDVGLNRVRAEVLAIRGDRLVLQRIVFSTADGREMTTLGLNEWDNGEVVRRVVFDEDALHDAVEELDDRYLAGQGEAHTAVLRPGNAIARHHHERDWDAMREVFAEDFVVVDHRVIGWPEADRDGIVELFRGLVELVPDLYMLQRNEFVRGHTALSTLDSRGTTIEGSEYQWLLHAVMVVGQTDRITRVEIFAEDAFEFALARLDELGTPHTQPAPTLTNAAMRRVQGMEAAFAARDWKWFGANYAADFVADDRRPTVNSGRNVGIAPTIALSEALADTFISVTQEPLAIRGERLVLVRRVFHQPESFDLEIVVLVEMNEAGLFTHNVLFDPDDLPAALVELDRRYAAGEGAEHADVIRVLSEGYAAMNRRDLDAWAAIHAPDHTTHDHAPIGFGELGTQKYADYLQAAIEQVPDFVFVPATIEVKGHVALVGIPVRATTPDGFEFEKDLVVVTRFTPDLRVFEDHMFAAEQWSEARARFESQGAADQSASSTAELANAATRLITATLTRWDAGNFDVDEYISADVVEFDRRRTVSRPTLHGRAAFLENAKALYGVFTSVAVEPVAIRGDRAALIRVVLSNDGFTSSMLGVYETDEHGVLTRGTSFDEEDFDAAIEELEDRHVACEGTPHEYMNRWLRDVARVMRLSGSDAARTLMAPDFALVDHRTLGYGSVDLTELTTLQAARNEQVTDDRKFHRTREIKGDAILAWYEAHASAPDGGEYVWSNWVVWQQAGGRWVRLEMFNLEDEAAARARFEELAAEPRTPYVDNTIVRTMVRARWLSAIGDFDGAGRDHIAENVERVDARHGVSAPTLHGRVEFMDFIRTTFEVYDDIDFEWLAVRGDDLALARLLTTSDGFETTGLALYESDESGYMARMVLLDDDDLAAAFDALDARYAEIRTDEPSLAERVASTHLEAFQRRDWAAVAECFATDFVAVDHRPLGFAESNRAQFLDRQQTLIEATPEGSQRALKMFTNDRAHLSVVHATRTTPEGNEYSWDHVNLAKADDQGRISRLERFPEDRWVDALALFDEWSGESDAPPLENAATHNVLTMLRLSRQGEFTEVEEHHLAVEVERFDRRHGISAPTAHGRAEFIENFRAIFDVFGNMTCEPIALRGNHLALCRMSLVSESGFEAPYLAITECDEECRYTGGALFDETDLVAALDELDERYLAGEGAEHDYLIRRSRDFIGSMAQLDGEATLAMLDPAIEFVDYRRLGLGAFGFDGVRSLLAARAEQVTEDISYLRTLSVRGDAVLGLLESRGVDEHGTAVLYEMYWVSRFVAGKIRWNAWYDLDDEAAARSRFEELAAESRTPHVDNAVVRLLARNLWRGTFDETCDPTESMADDLVIDDRRSGVSIGQLRGIDAAVENIAAQDDLFGPTTFEPLAVRGDHLMLSRTRAVSESGFELVSIGLFETNNAGQSCAMTFFDEDDRAGAFDALESRYAEIRTCEAGPAERMAGEYVRAFNRRDWDAVNECFAPDLVAIDHRSIGFPESGRTELLERNLSMVEVAPRRGHPVPEALRDRPGDHLDRSRRRHHPRRQRLRVAVRCHHPGGRRGPNRSRRVLPGGAVDRSARRVRRMVGIGRTGRRRDGAGEPAHPAAPRVARPGRAR